MLYRSSRFVPAGWGTLIAYVLCLVTDRDQNPTRSGARGLIPDFKVSSPSRFSSNLDKVSAGMLLACVLNRKTDSLVHQPCISHTPPPPQPPPSSPPPPPPQSPPHFLPFVSLLSLKLLVSLNVTVPVRTSKTAECSGLCLFPRF